MWPAILAGCGLIGLSSIDGAEEADKASECSLSDGKKGIETEAAAEFIPTVPEELERSLALSKAEADFFRRKWLELRARDEVLGIAALTGDEQAMHEKVVRIASELRQSERQRDALKKALNRVVIARLAWQQAEGRKEKAQRRAELEVALRQAREVLNDRPRAAVKIAETLADAVVVNVDEKLGVLIVNAGRSQGMKIGMSFRLIRQNRVVGKCRVMEVREFLSAVLITGLKKRERVRLGDKLLLTAAKK